MTSGMYESLRGRSGRIPIKMTIAVVLDIRA